MPSELVNVKAESISTSEGRVNKYAQRLSQKVSVKSETAIPESIFSSKKYILTSFDKKTKLS